VSHWCWWLGQALSGSVPAAMTSLKILPWIRHLAKCCCHGVFKLFHWEIPLSFFKGFFHEDPNFVSFQKIREDSSQQNCEYYKCATAVNPLSSQQGRRRRKEKE